MGEVFLCQYDGLPCERFFDDLGIGICEIGYRDAKGVKRSDVCSRFVLKCNSKFVEVSLP